MRSTGFVVLSIMVHCLAVAAIALNPQRLSEPQGDVVEITTGDDAETPGAADAPAETATQAQAAPAPAPVAPPQPAVEKAVEKPVEKVVQKPVQKPVEKTVKKAAPKKVAAAKPAPVQKSQPVEEQPENLDPEITENVETVPPAPVEEQQPEQTAAVEPQQPQEEVKPLPVKEAAPAPVAATAEKSEAKPEDTNKSAQPVAAAATAGAGEGSGELGHGGATKAGAVDHTELKQMNGNRAPFYPLSARRDKRQGNVELLYRVTKEGRVTDVQIANSSGSDDLDKEAVKAIAKFRFVPGQEGWARHPVQFTLKGETAEAPSRLRTKVGAQDAD